MSIFLHIRNLKGLVMSYVFKCFAHVFVASFLFSIEANLDKKNVNKKICIKNESITKNKPGKVTRHINDVIKDAYLQNPAIHAALAQKRAQDEILAQAFSGFLPNIEAKIGSSINSELKNRRANNENFQKVYSNQIALSLSQNLFNGLGTTYRIKSAEAQTIANRFKVYETEQEILMKTVEAYLNLWEAQQEVIICEKMCNNLAECLKASKEQLNVGVTKRQDYESFKSSHAEAEYRLIAAKAQVEIAKSTLKQYTGKEFEGETELPEIPSIIPASLSVLLESEIKNSPNLISAIYSKYAYEHNISVSKSAFSPSVDLNSSISRDFVYRDMNHYGTKDTTNNGHNKNDNFSVSAAVTLPIWINNGNNYFANLRKTKSEHLSASYSLEATKNEIIQQATQLWYSYISSRAQIKQGAISVKSAEISAEGYKKEEEFGTKSATDVVYNENELLKRRSQYIDAQKNYVLSAYKLLALVGKLSPEFLGINVSLYNLKENETRVKRAPMLLK